jgi:hypothetical protein
LVWFKDKHIQLGDGADKMIPRYYKPVTEIAPSSINHGNLNAGVVAQMLVEENVNRRSILIQNLSTNSDLYAGNAGVTILNTPKIIPGNSLTLYSCNAVYVIASAEQCDVRFLEEYCETEEA